MQTWVIVELCLSLRYNLQVATTRDTITTARYPLGMVKCGRILVFISTLSIAILAAAYFIYIDKTRDMEARHKFV